MADRCFYAQKWLMSDFEYDTAFLPKNLSSLSAHVLYHPLLLNSRCYLSLSFVGFPGVKTKKPVGLTGVDTKMVARTGIEPVTHGFSVRCSTN